MMADTIEFECFLELLVELVLKYHMQQKKGVA